MAHTVPHTDALYKTGASDAGWSLGHFAALLSARQTSPRVTKYKEIIWDGK